MVMMMMMLMMMMVMLMMMMVVVVVVVVVEIMMIMTMILIMIIMMMIIIVIFIEEGRYTWRHNSVLLYLANTFSSLPTCSLYADLPSFLSPSIITGDSLRPDLVLVNGTSLYILELTVGFESNMQINSDRKKAKYHSLISDLNPNYSTIEFINLSMSTLGLLGKSSDSLLSLLEDLKFDRPSSFSSSSSSYS